MLKHTYTHTIRRAIFGPRAIKHNLTLKVPPIICSRQFQILRLFQKKTLLGMIFHENRLLADDISYFFPKLEKMSQNLLSAAVVIGTLRVKQFGKKHYMMVHINY